MQEKRLYDEVIEDSAKYITAAARFSSSRNMMWRAIKKVGSQRKGQACPKYQPQARQDKARRRDKTSKTTPARPTERILKWFAYNPRGNSSGGRVHHIDTAAAAAAAAIHKIDHVHIFIHTWKDGEFGERLFAINT